MRKEISLSAADLQQGDYEFQNLEFENGVLVFAEDKVIKDEQGKASLKRAEELSSLTWAKKQLVLHDGPPERAWLIFLASEYPDNEQPLLVEINGHGLELQPGEIKGRFLWRKLEIKGQHLRRGVNEIILRGTEPRIGWSLAFQVSSTPLSRSQSSIQGVQWKNHIGHDGNWSGEYLVRLVLEEKKSLAGIVSPIIKDMGGRARLEAFSIKPDVALDGCTGSVRCLLRTANEEGGQLRWTGWFESGDSLTQLPQVEALQWRIILLGQGGPGLPKLRGVSVEYRFSEPVEQYCSPTQEIEHPFRGKDHEIILNHIIEQEGLRALVEAQPTEFSKILALRNWVSHQWRHYVKGPYPGWSPFIILEWLRGKQPDACGFCVIHTQVFYQLCLGLGFIARPVVTSSGPTMHTGGHFVSEVYSHEHNKWVMMDANYDIHYELDGEPLNALEVHNLYYRGETEKIRVVGDLSHHPLGLEGASDFRQYKHVGFIPFSELYDSIYNGPLEHGQGTYRWDGFLWWFDEYSPKQMQFTRYTNREQTIYFTPRFS